MPNQQLTLSPASLRMLEDFRKQPDVLPEHYQNLMRTRFLFQTAFVRLRPSETEILPQKGNP